MGISRLGARLLIRSVHGSNLRTMLTLGVQEMDSSQIAEALKSESYRFNTSRVHRSLYEALGLEVKALDASNFENADIIHNLNTTPLVFDTYDIIFDGGTLEHVFDIPNALKFIHRNLKVNGIVIHNIPSHNHVDHGFYMFSPTFLHDYYSQNNYSILEHYIYEYDLGNPRRRVKVYSYKPGEIDHLSIGGWGRKPLGIWFVAKKLETSTEQSNIIQSFYRKVYECNLGNVKALDKQKPFSKTLRSVIRDMPLLGKIVLAIKIKIAQHINRRPKDFMTL